MTSVDDVYNFGAATELPLDEVCQQVVAASQKAGTVAAGLEAAKDGAEQLVDASTALGMETKAGEAEAVRADAEALAARTSAVAQQLCDAAGELVAIKEEHTQLLARIQALSA